MPSKHIIISGGSRGLGLAISRCLLDAGYYVSTFSRTASEEVLSLESAYPDSYFFGKADIGDDSQLSAFVRHAKERQGPIFGVINNAALATEGILATLPEVEIEKMLSVNLKGAMLLTRLCLRDMLRSKSGGRVINVSSIIGSRGYTGLSVYAATKAGLDGLTRGLSREVGRLGITVNSVAPGYMRTEMSAGLNEDKIRQIVNRTPMKRLAELSDVTPLVEFLLSDGAKFITGQTILVDGGISC